MTIRSFFRLLIASTHRAPRHGTAAREISYSGLTLTARKALMVAQQEAQQFHHRYVGVEHILLGLLAVEEGAARSVLQQSGALWMLSSDDIRRQVALRSMPDRHTVPTRWLTNRAARVVEQAKWVANSAGCACVGSYHLLLALLQEEGLAMLILNERNVELDVVRAASIGLSCEDACE